MLGGVVLLVLAGRAVYVAGSQEPEDAPPAVGSMPPAGGASSPGLIRAPASPPSPVDARAWVESSSLAGTAVDGALVVDETGAFVPTSDAIDFFDYYLSALGEVPESEIVATIEREIRARVDPPDEALAFLRQYLGYRDAVRDLVESQGLEGFSLERRLQWLREARRGAFGPDVAEQLFGEEEARLREAIAWREAALDPDLSGEERDARLDALEAQLPEAERERRARATVARRTLQHETELREAGAGQGEVHSWREQAFGADAAVRLAKLDERRAEWDARVQHYRDERRRLEEGAYASEADEADAVEELRADLFEGPELLRIRALDRAGDR